MFKTVILKHTFQSIFWLYYFFSIFSILCLSFVSLSTFGSVYQDESDYIPPATKHFSGIPLVSIEITHEMVMDKLNALNPGESTGLDRLHPCFLCSLADILCTPLKILFYKSEGNELCHHNGWKHVSRQFTRRV